jgi:hypothetical protein
MALKLAVLVQSRKRHPALDRSALNPIVGAMEQQFITRARTLSSTATFSKEQHMFRKQHSRSQQLIAAAALVLGGSGVALADDSSMSRFGGDSYAYFNRQVIGNVAADPGWRQSHPNGLSERELQALSSSDLSAFASQLNPQVFSNVAADSTWRQTHPNGLTERELQALSASSLASWQIPGAATASSNVAQSTGRESVAARLTNFFHPRSDSNAGTY